MHNTPKRIVAVLLSVVMVLSVFGGMTFTASATTYSGGCGDEVGWTFENGVLTISGSGSTWDYDYDPPPWNDIMEFNENGDFGWISLSNDIHKIVISEGVTRIGNYILQGFDNVSDVVLPSTLTSIGTGAFYYSRMPNLHIPTSVTTIEEGAFEGCSSLSYICSPAAGGALKTYCYANGITYRQCLGHGTCGENLTWMVDATGVLTISGTGGMSDYESISPWRPPYDGLSYSRIVIENGVTYIGKNAFNSSPATSISIADSVQAIGRYAFCGSSLISVTVPSGVTEISMGAFEQSKSLKSVTLPNSVTRISPYAFQDCTSLTNITLPNRVTYIGDWAFCNCSSLVSVYIPVGIETIANGDHKAFEGFRGYISSPVANGAAKEYCDANGITFRLCTERCGDNLEWSVDENSVLSILGTGAMFNYTADRSAPWSGAAVTGVVIGDGVTSIGEYAFNGCTGLTNVHIPLSVKTIGRSAFAGCTNLSYICSLPIAKSTVKMYCDANGIPFQACSNKCGENLTWFLDANDVLSICGTGAMYDYTFSNPAPWSGHTVESVELENGVTTIGANAFGGLTSLKSITIPGSVTSIGNAAFKACSLITDIDIPTGVTNIGANAFEDCTNLTSVTIPGSVTSIGNAAFKACSLITDIAVPAGVTSIGASTFENCTGLAGVTIPNSVTSIGANAFYNCTTLTDIILPASITSVGANAFDNCINLTAVQYAGTVADWCGITFGNSAANPLYFAHDLYISGTLVEELVIPGSVRKIGDYAFYEDTRITSVTISDGVTEIGNYAFCSNTSLESVYIPDSVTTIGDGAFHSCSSLSSVEYVTGRNDVERSIGEYAFAYCNSENLTNIHIPASVTEIGENAFLGCNSADHPNGFYLCCAATNTAAEKYANDNNITFIQCTGESVVAVTFDPCDGTQAFTFYALNGGKLSQPDTPKRAGFMFRGWRLDGEMYDFDTPVTEEITLYGVWIEGEEAQASAMGGLSVSFEDGLPDGWQIINGVSGNYYWSVSTVDHQSGSHSLFSGTNSSEGDATWFISPKMNLSGQSRALSFAYKNALYNGALSGLDVYYRVNAGEWTRLIHITDAHSAWTTESIVLPSQALAKGVQFGFCATALSDVESESLLGRGVYLDDISVSLFESFENGGVPAGWTTESSPEGTEYIWSVTDPSDANGYIGYCAAWTGTDAAAGNTAWLIMPEMDLREADSLTFSYKNQKTFSSAQNNFGVYYRVNGGAWQELFSTSDSHSDYETETVVLPVGAQNESVQIGFCADIDSESTKKSSKGVYIDAVSLSGNIVSNAESSLNHNVTYSASGNVLTATCSNDPCAFEDHTLTLTLLAPEMTYTDDGKNAEATLTDLGKFNVELGLSISADDIRYLSGAQQLEAAPTTAGDYTASLTVTIGDVGYTITKDYVIASNEHDYNIPSGLTAIYGQTLADVTLTNPYGNTSGTWTWDDPTTSVGNAGDNAFPATFTPEDTENYNTLHTDLTVTVSPADPTATAPTGLTAVYGQTLSDVTLTNPAGNTSGTWTWDDPTTSVGNVGSRTFPVTFTPSDAENYNTVHTDLTVTVEKANPTATAPTGLTATVGQTLSDVTLTNPAGNTSGTWTWDNPTTSVGAVGEHIFPATFTPSDTSNYDTVHTNLTVTVTIDPNAPTKKISLVTSGAAANVLGAQQSSVWFGNYKQSSDGNGGYNVDPIQWRVLSNADGKLFLLSDQNLDVFEYDKDPIPVTWEMCDMRKWLNGRGTYSTDSFKGDAFTAAEYAAVSDSEVENADNPDSGTSGGNNTTDKVFLLSIAEAANTAYGFTNNDARRATNTAYVADGGHTHGDMFGVGAADRWWLRSPGCFDTVAASVFIDGSLATYGFSMGDDSVAVRPALNLNLNSVLFTSSAEGGKTGSGMTAVGDYDGADWKLTLLDNSRSDFTASCIKDENGVCTITYSGAQTGANEKISAMIVDQSGVVTYYGVLCDAAAGENTLTLDVSGKLNVGDKLYVFNEQVNGDKKTDYSSALVEVASMKADPTATAPTGLTATVGQTLSDVTLTNPAGNTSGTWTWDNPTTSVGAVGEHTFPATFTPSDATNYNTVHTTLTVTVSPVDTIATAPTGLTAVYGQTLADVTLTNPAGNTPGTWTWDDPTTSVGNAGDNAFPATFTPSDATNYNTVHTTLTVTVSPLNPTATAPTGLTAVYGQTLSDVTLSNPDGNTPGVWTWDEPTTPVGDVGNNAFPATFTPSDATIYNTVHTTLTVTVSPLNPTATAPTGLTATYGQTLADVTLTNPAGNTPGTWTWDDPTTSVGDVGSHSFPATFTPEDTDNYNTLHTDLTVTVEKADPTATAPTGLTATVGQTLSNVTLPAGWAWNDPTQSVGKAGTRAFAATFTPEDTANYNTVQANLTVSVSSASSVEPQDRVSVTIDDKISINFLLDLDARANPLIVSVDHMTADGQTTLKTQKFLVSYLTKTDDGLYRISFEMAPAQAADRYVIYVDGVAITQDIFSVADYCNAIRNDPTYGALARATLDYAQAANEVFSYTDVTIADLSKMNTDAIGAYTDGVYSDGTGKVSGASFMALTQPEFRFYTSSIAEADAVDYNTAGITAAYQNGEITDTLTAHFVKNSGGSVLLEVTGVSAEHMNETIVVTVTGLGTITFNGNAFAKSLSNSSKASSRALGAALYNYGEAANACFS